MLKHMMMISAFSLSLSAHASLLQCQTKTWNPSFGLTIGKDPTTHTLMGSLTRTITGFVATPNDTVHLGTDPLILKLNPSNCQLQILSKNNTEEQFSIKISLLSITEDLPGQLTGTLLPASDVKCSKATQLTTALQDICIRNPEIDTEIQFTKTTEVIQLLNMNKSAISNKYNGDESSIPFGDSADLPVASVQ